MFDYWNNFFETQKKAMEEWQKAFKPAASKDAEKPYEEMMKWWQQGHNIVNQWAQMVGQGKAFEPWNAWQELFRNYNPLQMSQFMNETSQEVFEKMLHAAQLKETLNRFWQELNKNMIVEPGEQAEKIIDQMTEQYKAILKENFIPLLPEQMRFYVESPYKLAQKTLKTVETFVSPWRSTYPNMSSLMIESMTSDPSKFKEFLKIWEDNYDKTVGELIKSPVVGSNRELIEQQNKMVHSMIEMNIAMLEYVGSISTVAAENARSAVEKYVKMAQDASTPKTFQEFYQFLSTDVEAAIEKYFFTDEFSKLIAKTTDSYMKFKIEADKLIERFMSQTPFVTNDKVDNVYKNVQELKREVRALGRKVEELEARLDAPKAKPTTKSEKE